MNRFWIYILLLIFATATAGAESNFYTIKKGDTLSKVSRESGVPVAILKACNGVNDSASLNVGRKILIPDAYAVKKGDTLYSISRRYGVTVNEIAFQNGLTANQTLKIDQKIFIASPKDGVNTLLTPAQESSVGPNAGGQVFWPHPGRREIYDGKMRGILITGQKGDLVYSVSKGRVIWAGPYRGFGNVVLVAGNDGLVFGYMGIEELVVSAGEEIESGSAVGRMGVYFHKTDAKLLFIVYHNIKRYYLDPQDVLNSSHNSKG